MKHIVILCLNLLLVSSCVPVMEGVTSSINNGIDTKIMRDQNGELLVTTLSFKKADSAGQNSLFLSGELNVKSGTKRNETFYDLRPILFYFQSLNSSKKEVRKDAIKINILGIDLSSVEVNKSYQFTAIITGIPENQFSVIANVLCVGSNQWEFAIKPN